MKSIAL